MRVKNLTHDQNFSERALTNTKVMPLNRTSTNNLIEYFNDSHYLDNKVDTNQVTIEQNVQVQQYQIAVVTQTSDKTNLHKLRLSLAILILAIVVGIYSVAANLSILKTANTAQANSNTEFPESTLLKRQLIASRLEVSNPNYLQSMAMNIMQDEHWDVQKVHYFKLGWKKLEQEQQGKTRNQIWFQLFENTLIRELNGYTKQVEAYDYNTVLRERALLSLARSLEIQAPSHGEASSMQSILANYKDYTDDNYSENKSTDIKNNSSPSTSSELPIQVASLSEISNVNLGIAQSPQADLNHRNKPTEEELDIITAQFVNSYELGDINQFTALFTNNVVSNSHEDITGLKEHYTKVFNNTADRQMILHDIKWKFRKGKAVGKAKMELSLVSTKNSQKKEQLSRLQLVAEKQHDKVVFTRFYLLNK